MWDWEKAIKLDLAKYVTGHAYGLVSVTNEVYSLEVSPEQVGKAIFSSLASQEIRYSAEPYSNLVQIQRIRDPLEVFAVKEGTCLDLALLFAGLCLDYRLLPILIALDGHIFVAISSRFRIHDWDAYSRKERSYFVNSYCDNPEFVKALVLEGGYVPIECTGFAMAQSIDRSLPEGQNRDSHGLMSFDTAKVAALSNLSSGQRKIDFAIDLADAKLGCLIGAADLKNTLPTNQTLLKATLKVAGRYEQSEFLACPYPGIAPIDATKKFGADLMFCGRRDELAELLKSVTTKQIVTVIGPSGSGKSSLVLGGLVGELSRQNRKWKIHTIRPDNNSVLTLKSYLGIHVDEDCVSYKSTLAKFLQENKVDALLIVVDQLEAILDQQNRPFCDALVQFLLELAGNSSCSVAITVRSDYYEELLQLTNWKLLTTSGGRVELSELSRKDLKDLIVLPAQEKKVEVEDSLVSMLQDDCAGEPGHLPFLQETLVLIWNLMTPTDLRLRSAAYEAFCSFENGKRSNGLETAIEINAKRVYTSIPKDSRNIVPLIFLALVQLVPGRKALRKQLLYSELVALIGDKPEKILVIERLVSGRLLTKSGKENSKAKIDIAHDALLSGWDDLKTWLAEYEKEKITFDWLQGKVISWQTATNKSEAFLNKVELKRVDEWSLGSMAALISLDSETQEFLRQCRSNVGGARFRNAAILCVLVSSLISLVVMIFMIQDQNRENRVQLLCSQVRRLVNEAPERGTTALLLAIHAFKLQPSSETYDALVSAMSLVPHNFLLGKFESVKRVVFSRDNKILLIAQPNAVSVYSLIDGTLLKTLQAKNVDFDSLCISSDGSFIAYNSGEKIYGVHTTSSPERYEIAPRGQLLGVFTSPANRERLAYIASDVPNIVRVCEIGLGQYPLVSSLLLPKDVNLKRGKFSFDMHVDDQFNALTLLASGSNLYLWSFAVGDIAEKPQVQSVLDPNRMERELPPPTALPPPPLPGETIDASFKYWESKPKRDLRPPEWIRVNSDAQEVYVSDTGSNLRKLRIGEKGVLDLAASFPGVAGGTIRSISPDASFVYLNPFYSGGELVSPDLKIHPTLLNEMRNSSDLWVSPNNLLSCIYKNNELRVWNMKPSVQTTRRTYLKALSCDGKLGVLQGQYSDLLCSISSNLDYRVVKEVGKPYDRYVFSPNSKWFSDGSSFYSVDRSLPNQVPCRQVVTALDSIFSKDGVYGKLYEEGHAQIVNIKRMFESARKDPNLALSKSKWRVGPDSILNQDPIFNQGRNELMIREVLPSSEEFVTRDASTGDAIFRLPNLRAVSYELLDIKAVKKTESQVKVPGGLVVGLFGDWSLTWGRNDEFFRSSEKKKLLAVNTQTGKTYELNQELVYDDLTVYQFGPSSWFTPKFSTGGLLIAYPKSRDKRTVGLLNLNSGRDVKLNFASPVAAVYFSPDDKYALISLDSGAVSIFRLGTHPSPVLVGTLQFDSPMSFLAFDGGDKEIICGSDLELARTVWLPGDVLLEAESRVNRSFANSEIAEFEVSELQNSPSNTAVDLSKSTEALPTIRR